MARDFQETSYPHSPGVVQPVLLSLSYQNFMNDSVGTYNDYGFTELIVDATYSRYTAGFSLGLDSDAADVGKFYVFEMFLPYKN